MIRIILLLLLQMLLLTGLGRWVQQWLWGARRVNLAETTWFGLAVVILLLQLWHLFLPVINTCNIEGTCVV
jgi:hypothetical protein